MANHRESTSHFIEKATKVHGNRYNYDKVVYYRSTDKVIIICPEHGEFWQTPELHYMGHGCRLCSENIEKVKYKVYSNDDFIRYATGVHGDFYDYSLVEYKSNSSKVIIICPYHGQFVQKVLKHLKGQGCSACAHLKTGSKRKTSIDKFISQSKLIHGDIYDYSLVNYITARKKVLIRCFKHGKFLQYTYSHLSGNGCPYCAHENTGNRVRLTTEEFCTKALLIHGDTYDYSLVSYKSAKIPVNIICKKHGVFNQQPTSHLAGIGCPSCSRSKGELFIEKILNANGILFKREFRIKGQRKNQYFRFDFMIPSLSIIIEYHGGQHFAPCEAFGGMASFMSLIQHDEYKKRWAIENGYMFIQYTCDDRRSFISKNLTKIILNSK